MTRQIWNKTFEVTMMFEGNYQCMYSDRGNWTSGKVGEGELKGTKFGISAMSYPNLDIKNLSYEQAQEIYLKDYWERCKCDFIPDALSMALFDFAVNSGTKTAIKYLQKALNIKADGVIGNQTIGSCNRIPTRGILEKYIQYRLEYLRSLKTWDKFGNGWGRRVNLIKKICEEYL